MQGEQHTSPHQRAVTCWHCGKKGHVWRECPTREKPATQECFPAGKRTVAEVMKPFKHGQGPCPRVKSFLGLASFYRHFIAGFANIAAHVVYPNWFHRPIWLLSSAPLACQCLCADVVTRQGRRTPVEDEPGLCRLYS